MTNNPDNTHLASYDSAVRTEGRDVVVTANAGSGKTHLLVDRYFQLLARGIHPNSVVAFTFTEKTARQLKDKILQTLPRHPDFASLPKGALAQWREQIHQAPIGTIHQFCLRILQESTGEGIPFRFNIIDEATEMNLRESVLNRLLKEEMDQWTPALKILLPIYGMPGLRDVLREVVKHQENIGETAPPGDDLPPLEKNEEGLLEALLGLARRVRQEMALSKERRLWLSFFDLEVKGLENLKNPGPGLQNFLSPLSHVLVDEFQDTSPVQIALLESLRAFKAKRKQELFLFAVGDPKQSIYRFRKVDRRLIERTREGILKNGGLAFLLPKNYRSLPGIVNFSNHFSAKAFPDAAPSQALRVSDETKVHIVKLPDPETDPKRASRQTAEARWIAERIFSCRQAGHPWESMAVLFRASVSALPLIDQFKALSIPFTLRGGRDLFDRQEILDLKNLLCFLAHPQEDLYLTGLLRSPLFLISDGALFFLMRDRLKGQSLFHYLTGGSLPELLRKHLPNEIETILWATDRLRRWVEQAPLLSPHAMLRTIIYQLDLRRLYGAVGGDWDAPLAIEQFLAWLSQVETEMDPPDLNAVVSLLKQLGRTPISKAPLGDVVEGSGCVHLLTIHSAKGLQFPTVFLLDLAKSSPPFRDSVQCHGGEWALKIPDAEGEYQETPRFKELKEIHLREEAEENKRLLYVALTRAQDELFIPLTAKPRGKNNLQSLLMENISEEFLESFVGQDEPVLPSMTLEKPSDRASWPANSPFRLTFGEPPLPCLTVSQMEAFSQCPIKYYFSHHQGYSDEEWKDPKQPSQTLMGTLLHRALHYRRNLPNEAPVEIVRRLLQTEPLWNQELLVADLVAHLENYLASPAYGKISRAEEDHSELPFLLKLSNGYIRGQLDRLVRRNGTWHLIDFKFSTRNLTVQEVRKDYGFQLKTYALAARQFLRGQTPSVEVHLLGNSQALPLSFSDSDFTDHQNLLQNTIGGFQKPALEEVRFHEFCYPCPFNRTVPLCPVPKGEIFSF